MRKVNIDIVAVVMVPVEVKASLLVRADEGINMERALTLFAKGQHNYECRHGGADLEDIELVEITRMGGAETDLETIEAAIAVALNNGFRVVESEVVDSR